MLSFKEGIPSAETAIIKPNLNSIRKILGGDGTDQQRKVVEENTGLIPKYYKASIIITFLELVFTQVEMMNLKLIGLFCSRINSWNQRKAVVQSLYTDAISVIKTTVGTIRQSITVGDILVTILIDARTAVLSKSVRKWLYKFRTIIEGYQSYRHAFQKPLEFLRWKIGSQEDSYQFVTFQFNIYIL